MTVATMTSPDCEGTLHNSGTRGHDGGPAAWAVYLNCSCGLSGVMRLCDGRVDYVRREGYLVCGRCGDERALSALWCKVEPLDARGEHGGDGAALAAASSGDPARSADGALLERWRLWMLAQGLSLRTITERQSTVRALLAYVGARGDSLTPDGIQSFLAREMSKATRATYHASIRAFCAWMLRTGERSDNPADHTPRPRRPKSRPRPITREQVAAVVAAANRRRTHDYVMLAALAGLRVHEIAKLHGRDVDVMTNVLTVKGKGGKVAQIPLHDELRPMAERMPKDDYWFPSYDPEREEGHVSAHAVSAAISGAMARAGVNATPHQLRHYYATALVAAGVHLRVVQQLMRHESAGTTAGYADVDADQLRRGINQLEAT